MKAVEFAAGGYRFIQVDGVFQFSSGVRAESGHTMVRAQFVNPLPLADGFAAVEAHLASIGRPTTAFSACELRSPAPFTEKGFIEFNRLYVQTLERWGLYSDGVNPVARTNVCPQHNPPPVASLHAFSYTIPSGTASPTFVLAGNAECAQGPGEYRDSIVRRGETGLDAMREKLRFVRAEQELRLRVLGLGWSDVLHTGAYTVHDIGPLIREELLDYGTGSITWHPARPPVEDCEYEMDARTTSHQILL
ncbi:hypothetical protein ACIBSV_42420 [Embleya sp. NPDC050154]|uniref:2-amino-5-chloromuconate deaminase CnbZ n=1 Tax=unclassified Embleya TaxID=2699296 RepID=UPI0037AA0BC6